jgi:hypothetical protein
VNFKRFYKYAGWGIYKDKKGNSFKWNRTARKFERYPKIGDVEKTAGMTKIYTQDGWANIEQNDTGNRDLDEVNNKIKSFLERIK